MLNGMAEDCEVNPVYVLDLYRHGKVNWMLDFAIQIAVVVLWGVVYMSVAKIVNKHNERKMREHNIIKEN